MCRWLGVVENSYCFGMSMLTSLNCNMHDHLFEILNGESGLRFRLESATQYRDGKKFLDTLEVLPNPIKISCCIRSTHRHGNDYVVYS